MIRNVVIIEDEKLNADRLVRLLKEIRPETHINAVIESISDTINWLSNNQQPDVIFMDIRLCDGISFEIFEKTTINSPVIFTTAYDEYAVKAFKYNSIDYLLKPVKSEELKAAIEKLESTKLSFNLSALDELTNFLSSKKEYRTRFLLPYRDGYKSLLVERIAFIYTENRITYAQIRDESQIVVLPHTMEELEQQLDPRQFFRTNRQYIVHIDAIQKIFNHFNGKLKVELKHFSETEILISREKASAFKQWLDY